MGQDWPAHMRYSSLFDFPSKQVPQCSLCPAQTSLLWPIQHQVDVSSSNLSRVLCLNKWHQYSSCLKSFPFLFPLSPLLFLVAQFTSSYCLFLPTKDLSMHLSLINSNMNIFNTTQCYRTLAPFTLSCHLNTCSNSTYSTTYTHIKMFSYFTQSIFTWVVINHCSFLTVFLCSDGILLLSSEELT